MKYKILRFEDNEDMLLPSGMQIVYKKQKNGKSVRAYPVEEIDLSHVDREEIKKVIKDPRGMAISLSTGKAIRKSGTMMAV